MSPAEFYTFQFYAWEYRGRGWLLSDEAVHLEPPFIPFFRHGGRRLQIDDGKRHSFFSKLFSNAKGTEPIYHEEECLDYETIEPFLFETDRTLEALQVRISKESRPSSEKMKALLTMLSFTFMPISFEIIGIETDIIIQFVIDAEHIDALETYAKAYFQQYVFLRNNEYVEEIIRATQHTMVIDFGLQEEFVRPLAVHKNNALDPLTGVFAMLDDLREGEQGGMQVLFQTTCNRWNDSIERSVTMYDGTSFFADDPDAPHLAKQKIQSPLYGVTIRVFGQGETAAAAERIVQGLGHSLIIGSKSPANALIALNSAAYDFVTRVDDILLRESHRLGMLLSQDELLSFIHFPSEHITSPKLYGSARKTKAVPGIALGKKFVIGNNVHNGVMKEVTLSSEDRLKHMHIIGATGTGKSTLIANLINQDIHQQHSIVVFDPHGDLVDEVIAHMPAHRLKDVVLVDPSDIEYPIGLNILEAHTDTEKEVLSSDLVAAFKRYATSWGDQMSGVLGNAILAILESTTGGSIHDLRRFLIESDFRNKILKTVSDPAVLYYWLKEFPILKTNAIGPILIRLDTFLRPRSIRNMVSQKKGLDLEKLLAEKKIIVLKLSQGLIGKENSFLLGSLFLSKLHQIIMRRQQGSVRDPLFIYIDEFHQFITPSVKEMLSGIRKYHAGLILAHQDLQQLQREDGELLNSILGNVYTRIVFRVGEQDAKKLQEGFSAFDQHDLQSLARGEAIMRIEQPNNDCSITTEKLPDISEGEKTVRKETVVALSRKNYATSKEDVEQDLRESLGKTQSPVEQEIIKKETVKETILTPLPPKAETEPVAPAPLIIQRKEIVEQEEPAQQESTHRYLQNLIKRMAESKGYKAVLEQQLLGGNGKVDVHLEKGKSRIAIEICITTNETWEMHNIQKCLTAKYDQVISVSGDIKQLERIKKKCLEDIPDFAEQPVLFYTPDALFQYFEDMTAPVQTAEQQVIKGYKVNVTYEAQSEQEMDRKRSLVAKVVSDAMKRKKK